jgi:tetratricopeptide (TPR) repeat protein
MMRHTIQVGVLAAAVLLSSSALGQASNVDQARMYFELGAQAYETKDYLAAVEAFQKAYKLVPRENLIFSIGQAYRKLYYAKPEAYCLRQAMDHYRDYVAKAVEGARVADARQAIGELEPLYAKLGPDEGTAPSGDETQADPRLMIQCKVKGAKYTLDGGPLKPMPLFEKVKPGTHKVRVMAAGYYDEERDVPTEKGAGSIGFDIQLRPKAAKVVVNTDDGADVLVNGRSVGETPLTEPVALPAGAHFLAISLNGTKGYSEELALKRGEKRTLDIELATTPQRTSSYVMMGLAGASLVAGGVFAGVAASAEGSAKDINTTLETTNIERSELERYNGLLDRRDAFRVAAGVGLGSGVLLGITGLLLYAFDEPSIEAPRRAPAEEEKQGEGQEEAPAGTSLELGALPVWIPGGAMGVVTARF